VKLYTKTGDAGETTFVGGTRVPKSHPRVAAYGEVDEIGAWLGLVRAEGVDAQIDAMLDRIQRDLFAIGSHLADPTHRLDDRQSKTQVTGADVVRLEGWIDELDAQLPPLTRFVLAGGAPAGARLHVARTVCRRAERHIVALGPGGVEPVLLAYVNRLSDLLFVMARAVNRGSNALDEEW
jgi:cob(I)alamin adenosyltransferase